MNSLEQRLQLSLAVSLIALMGLFGWLFTLATEQLMTNYALSRLQHDGENLLGAIQFNASSLSIDDQRIGSIYHRALSGHYYQIEQPDGQLQRSRSLWDQQLPPQNLATGEQRQLRIAGPAQQQLLIWAAGYEKSGQRFSILVAEDIGPLLTTLRHYNWGFAAATVVLLVLLMLVQRLVLHRAFGNLRRLQAAIARLEAGEIEQLPEDVPSEVIPLVQEINRLLGLMGQRLQRSRNAVGNLAHALKGPLNLLTQLADSREIPAPAALQAELRTHTAQLRRLIEHELKRARLAGSGSPGQRFVPAQELPAMLTLLQRIHRDKSLRFEMDVDDSLALHIDRDDMLELLGNLLDNAAKWANGRVRCRITDAEQTRFEVEDDGPGCSEEDLQRLTERGTRLDESTPGHGLGLAIVQDIVTLYHGKLTFDRSPELQGLRVIIRLPR